MKAKRERARILIAEDSPTQAAQLRFILAENGYQVVVARNGLEALTLIEEKKPTAVISDIIMPVMDGYELCRRIKAGEATRNIPVILVTSLSDPEDVISGLDCGADSFLLKPYDEQSLLLRIDFILMNKELREQAAAEMGIEVFFAGQKRFITSDRLQIVNLLFSTFETVLHKSRELERVNRELVQALELIKAIRGHVDVCMRCQKIQGDRGAWRRLEDYIQRDCDARFSRTVCPECEAAICETAGAQSSRP